MAVSVAVLLLAFLGSFWLRLRSSHVPFQHVQLQRLTTSGDTAGAAISPDGKYLARIVEHGDELGIWLRQLSTSTEVQVVPAAKSGLNAVQFSRDGEHLYYTQSRQPGRFSLYRIPSLGGAAELVLDNATGPVWISPDERHFAWQSGRADRSFSIIVAGPNVTSRKTVVARNAPDFLRDVISWSPEAKLLAVPLGSFDDRFWNIERVLIVPLGGARPAIFWPVKWNSVLSVSWLPSGRGILVNGVAEGSSSTIWFAPYPTGEPRRLINDANNYFGLSTTADSAAFVTDQAYQNGEIWITAPHAGLASQLTRTSPNDDGAGGFAWAPDGRLIYSSTVNRDLWLANADGSDPKRLTFGGVAIDPEVSPDGRTIYFGSERSGACHLWRMDLDANESSQVTRGSGEEGASVSPDGKWLLYESFSFTGDSSIWKMPLPSGTPVRLGDLKNAEFPSVSPDGQWVSVAYRDERFVPREGVGILRLDGTGFKPLSIPFSYAHKWSADSRALYFLKSERGVQNVWKQAVAGGTPTRVTSFTSGSIGPMAVSREERLAFRHFNSISDVVLVRSIP